MRTLVLLLLLTVFGIRSYSQTIDYKIPEGFENAISSADYKKLVDLAVPIVQQKYRVESVRAGTIQLVEGQEMTAFDLHGFITECVAITDRSRWKAVIQDGFNKLFTSIQANRNLDISDFEALKKYLTLRIYPIQTVLQRGKPEDMVLRTDLEGTYTVVMMDMPGLFSNIKRELSDLWKRDTSEIFKVAQSNVAKQAVEKVTRKFEMGGGEVEVSFIGEETYAAAYALNLAQNTPEMVGEWGSIVAIPNGGLVDICKISKQAPLDFTKFIQQMNVRVEASFSGHANPVSKDWFWYYKGKFTKVDVQTGAGGQVSIVAPAGLTALMTVKKK